MAAGNRDGAVASALASHQCDLGSIPRICVICRLSLLLILVLASTVFSPGTPVFPPSSKTNIFKFQFDLEFEGHRFVSHTRLLSVTLAKESRFIYFIFNVNKSFFASLACAKIQTNSQAK